MDQTAAELERIRAALRQRTQRYDPLEPWIYMSHQERERAFIRWVDHAGLAPLADKRLLEVGCGTGTNLLQFLRLGFAPEKLVGNDLMEERIAVARHILPSDVTLVAGDASTLAAVEGGFDVVFQSLMCTSILSPTFLQEVADRMWALTRPGGGVLWFDLIVNNPSNPNLRAISIRRLRKLFPSSNPKIWRVTLAPPISRLVTRIHPSAYSAFNLVPALRVHVMAWLPKPGTGAVSKSEAVRVRCMQRAR